MRRKRRRERKARAKPSSAIDPGSDVEPGADCDCGLEQEALVREKQRQGQCGIFVAICGLGMKLDHSGKATEKT